MTRDDVIRIARDTGAEFRADTIIVNGKDADDFVVAFANQVIADFLGRTGQYVTNHASRKAVIAEAVAAERAACAKLCDEYECHFGDDCANAIRARGEKGGA